MILVLLTLPLNNAQVNSKELEEVIIKDEPEITQEELEGLGIVKLILIEIL